ncbi:hypothetical protein [Streptomyces sp. NPDC055109]
MQLIESLYLGWSPLSHGPGCPSLTWDSVEILRDEGGRIVQSGAERHACANADCSHTDTFTRVQLRLLCRDCSTVRTITGENLTDDPISIEDSGWGLAPREVSGVWLWPGQPVISGGEPNDYLVTRTADGVTTENLYGIISGHREADNIRRWIAAALPDPDGPHGEHSLRWQYRTAGLADVAAAAAWIAGAETRALRPLVVSV